MKFKIKLAAEPTKTRKKYTTVNKVTQDMWTINSTPVMDHERD